MAAVSESMNTLTGWIGDAVRLGLGLVGAFLVADVLFPGSTNIVANVGKAVDSFACQGLTGLLALVIFMVIMRR